MDADRGHVAPFVPDGGTNGGAPHVRRLRTLKRKKEEKVNTRNQVKLERVLGLTVASNASLATAPATGETNITILGSDSVKHQYKYSVLVLVVVVVLI